MSPRPQAEPFLRGLAVATMFRGDRRQLTEWCNFHLNAGADQLYVALDRPSPELLEALPQDPSVHWEVIDSATWDRFYAADGGNVERRQVDAIRWLARRAGADGHTYLAFVDSDELLDLAVPFEDVARSHPDALTLTVPVREMWYAERAATAGPFGATLALGQAPQHFDWKRAFGWRAQYFRNGLLGHDLGKSIYKLPLASGQFSVHSPVRGALRSRMVTLTDDTARVLHFDCGTVATWSVKWGDRLSGDVVASGLGSHRRAQQQLFAHVLRRPPQEQVRFFERFYTIGPETLSELEKIGMAERVDLGSMLSGPMPVPASPGAEQLVQLPSATRRTDAQFAMVCDRNFVKPTFATMISVLSQIDPRRSVRFVVLGDGLKASDVRHLRSLEHTAYDVEVQVHDITRDLDRDLGAAATGVSRSRATYGRAYLVDLLPEQRTVYLDGDVLATRDIVELFDLDLGDACIAGVPDSAAFRLVADPNGVPVDQRMRLTGVVGADPLEYLNAGVLVLDLDNPDFRELSLLARAHVTMEGRALAQHDQDAINMAFAGRKHRLPATYNYMTQFYTSDRCLDGDLVTAKYSAADASLIHFSGRVKPWVTRQDEFYNGLYRKLVSTAEERLGVSCGFYFSRPEPGLDGWSADRWAENLDAVEAAARPPRSRLLGDVRLVDITDRLVYLRLTPEAYLHAVSRGLHLVARSGGNELFDIPLDRLSPQQTHLRKRAALGIRTLPVDLVAALSAHGGVARNVEFVLAGPERGAGFERSLGVSDVLAAGSAATPDLLGELPIDGAVEGLEGGRLGAWYRAEGGDPVSLHVGGELVAQRAEPAGDDGIRAIRFRAANMVVRLGYGTPGDELSVRVPGTNVPLPGPKVTVDDVHAATAAAEAAAAAPAASLGRRARVVGRVRSEVRARVPEHVRVRVRDQIRRLRG